MHRLTIALVVVILLIFAVWYFAPRQAEHLAPNLARFLGTDQDDAYKSRYGPGIDNIYQ
jgi:hypothetical protein